MTYDNIKSHKKQGFTVSLEDTLFTKPEERVKLTHQPPFSHHITTTPPPSNCFKFNFEEFTRNEAVRSCTISQLC